MRYLTNFRCPKSLFIEINVNIRAAYKGYLIEDGVPFRKACAVRPSEGLVRIRMTDLMAEQQRMDRNLFKTGYG